MDEELKTQLTARMKQSGERLKTRIVAAGSRRGASSSDFGSCLTAVSQTEEFNQGFFWQLLNHVGLYETWVRYGQDWPLDENQVNRWTQAVEDLVMLLNEVRGQTTG
jgi:hypothetical protein